ncbi:YtzI protein [Virgibacillus sp. 179-BFC.A HS]|uniref:YtzI protein n=1 Tax=Tigheibacillus jepli TaxID=3035914 RepID=A0ABU5CKR0_9BACI|nr:YtzI protein [Virgibacillus sp. 179-BFC.A HS]MDY0406956.1 YtzI protein [Virgibacillus sp. 179-BFC.A HS]
MITAYVVIGGIIMLVILAFSLLAITKGYAYKHTTDPHPNETENQANQQQYNKLNV